MTEGRAAWDERHGNSPPGAPEPFVIEMLAMLPQRRGIALDVAAGRGRHSIVLARARFLVVAIDYSQNAMRTLASVAHAERLPIYPVVADLSDFPLKHQCYDAIVDVNFLDRALIPDLRLALKPGGALIFDAYTRRQSHTRSPQFMLAEGELRELLAGMEIVRYREGAVPGHDGNLEYRASALALRTH